jgi:arylformamidase
MLYRGMDRTRLDAAYNNSAAVAEYEAIKSDWNARSARIRQIRRGHLDLEYGASPRQRDKEGFAFLAEGPLARGINVANVEYTLAPDARMDEIVVEIRHTVAWLAEHLGDFDADPARIYVAGHSAGGHLTSTAMVLATVKGGLAISGLYDLEPIRLNYLNAKLGLDAAEARRNSPILHLPQRAGPLIIAYGAAELPELRRQSVEYARAWLESGLSGNLLEVEGADHFTILESLAHADGALTRALVDMVAAQTRQTSKR